MRRTRKRECWSACVQNGDERDQTSLDDFLIGYPRPAAEARGSPRLFVPVLCLIFLDPDHFKFKFKFKFQIDLQPFDQLSFANRPPQKLQERDVGF